MSKSPVEIVNDAEVPTEILASSIVTISQGMKKLLAGRLTNRALLLLIRDNCTDTIGLDKIRMVLDAIGDLERRYVQKVAK
jgi:hypothetical protein